VKQLNARYGFVYELRQFLTSDHLTIATNDQYAEGAAWLGDRRVVRDPARVSLVVDSRNDYSKRQLVADHAYWLSGLVVRQRPAGVVEATSLGFGLGDRSVVPSTRQGVMTGGYKGPMPWVSSSQTLGPVVRVPGVDHLDLQVRNLSSVTVDLRRARLTCRATVTVRSDGPVRVLFPACGKAVRVGAGTTSLRL